MAQNECQQMAKLDFYANLRNFLSSLYGTMQKAEKAAEFLNTMDADTLDNMGVPASGSDDGLRNALVDCRTALNELRDFYSGTATTQTRVMKDVINDLRSF